METLIRDVKLALRMFRENPGFTATALAALVLGIGANVAIFSVVNAVLLKPVPFPEPDRLVRPINTQDGNPAGGAASPAKYMHWRAQTDVLEDVAAFRNTTLNYEAGDLPERVDAALVSAEYFRTFRVPIVQGRAFVPEEDRPGGPKATVISHEFWTQRLGVDPNVIGIQLTLSGDAYTVVGIAGADLDMREFGDPELWVPFQLDPNATDQGHYFTSAARLKPGVTLEQAHARLAASAAAYRERFPIGLGENGGFGVISYQESIVGPQARSTLLVLFGAVGLVLLIACANVANLLLVRANGRRREIAIRAALGAGRWRIMRQLLTESVILSTVGGLLGLIVGFIGMRALLSVNTAGLPRLGDAGSLMGMDWRVVVFTVLLSLATGILFGLVPALVTSRSDLNAVIKDSSSRSGSGFRQNKTRSVLVTLEVGLAVVLLIGAALLIRTSFALGQVDPGFNPENAMTMRITMSGPRFATSDSVEQTARNALERIRSMPGVVAATATCCVPLQGGYGLPFNIIGRVDEGPFTGGGGVVISSSGYFETFDVPVLRGRAFTDADDSNAPAVVVINEALADQYWPDGGDPLQERMLIGGGARNMKELAEEPVRQIIGVVGDIRASGLSNDPGPTMYIPQAQVPDALNALNMETTAVAWVVRTRGDPAAMSAAVQQELRQATGLPVMDVQLLEEVVSVSVSRERLNMLLMTVFGASALLLAAIGIYGLMAYSVQQRAQELGIRMALGAEPVQVRGMVIRQGMLLVAVGVGAGLIVAFYLANLLASVLFGVEPRDVAVFSAVPLVLCLIGLAAVTIPAGRASRADPLDALRYE